VLPHINLLAVANADPECQGQDRTETAVERARSHMLAARVSPRVYFHDGDGTGINRPAVLQMPVHAGRRPDHAMVFTYHRN